MTNKIDIAKILIDSGVSLEDIDISMNKPIHYVVIDSSKEIFDMLIEKNVDLNCKNDLNFTPIQIAITNNNYEIFKTLLDKNADLNISGPGGDRPIHTIISVKNDEMLSDLFTQNSQDIDVEIENNIGLRPIHIAAIVDNYKAIGHLILLYHVDVNCIDNYGWKPIHYAIKHMSYRTITLLESDDFDFVLDELEYPDGFRYVDNYEIHYKNFINAMENTTIAQFNTLLGNSDLD